MFCQKCGKELANTAKFCPYCGATVQAENNAPVQQQPPVVPPPVQQPPVQQPPVQQPHVQQAPAQQQPPVQPPYAPTGAQPPYTAPATPPKKKKLPVWAIVLIVIGALVIAGTVCTLIIGHLFIKGVSEAVEEYDVESQLNEWSKEFEDYTTDESTTTSNKDSQKDFSKVERPELKDFSWYKGLAKSLPAGVPTITDTKQISGRWKAYYVIKEKGYELNNIEISSKDNKITVTIDPYEHFADGKWVYNSTAEKYSYTGENDKGSIVATSDKNGAITLFSFYEKDGVQYGFGTTVLQSGEMVDIALVRP